MTILRFKQPFVVFMMIVALCGLSMTINAQSETLGSLTIGQPVISEISADSTPRYDLTLVDASLVTFQAISETSQPTITISRGDEIVASESNTQGVLILSFTAFLTPGDYVVELGSANSVEGSIVLVVESAVPVSLNELPLLTAVRGQVSPENPVALYQFSAVGEGSFVYILSELPVPGGGVSVRLFNETLNRESGSISSELVGGMFNIPANGASYRLEIEYGGSGSPEPFILCRVVSSISTCDASSGPATPELALSATPVALACTVTPANGAVNIRSSASTEAPVVAPLNVGETANVIGISPDGFFHNILLGSINGWVAASVVNMAGDCNNIALVEPPNFVPVATQAPTLPPLPTATATSAATQPPTPTNTPSGPCLLTLNSPVKVYTEPIEQVDFLYDQVQSGELIPVGRLADGSWWKTNYANAWVPTYLFGGAITVSGNCSLPVVTP